MNYGVPLSPGILGPALVCSKCRAPWHEECGTCAADWDHDCKIKARLALAERMKLDALIEHAEKVAW